MFCSVNILKPGTLFTLGNEVYRVVRTDGEWVVAELVANANALFDIHGRTVVERA